MLVHTRLMQPLNTSATTGEAHLRAESVSLRDPETLLALKIVYSENIEKTIIYMWWILRVGTVHVGNWGQIPNFLACYIVWEIFHIVLEYHNLAHM